MHYRILIFLLFASSLLSAQSVYVPLDQDYYHLIDRYEIKSGEFLEKTHTTVKPFQRQPIAQMADSIGKDTIKGFSEADIFNVNYLQIDNWEWSDSAGYKSKRPFLKRFYRAKNSFFHVDSDDFHVQVNPVLYLSAGRESASESRLYQNTRGMELRGMINKKVGFYSLLTENQAVYPLYVRNYTSQFDAVPGEGYYKLFKQDGVDFLQARGYITFNATKNIALQFGHDRNFIGNGYRSLILSDFAPNYTFLKVNTQIWKINYMNLFAEMNGGRFFPQDHVYPKKYFALHHFSINLTKNLNIGIFESVVIGRNDTLGSPTGFDVNYLNPIIFYRAIEQHVGSPDNVKVGLDYKWNFLKHFSLYGQLVLDEFYLKHLRARNGWWANKQSVQSGVKYIDVAGVKNLDIQAEVNVVRPYMYTHYDNFSNYSHYNQAIAHPLGANFYELIGIIRYQPVPRLNLTAKTFFVRFGGDTAGSNWGGNILLDYSTFEREFGNRIGQGVTTDLIINSFTLTYQLKHNLFCDINYTRRNTYSILEEFSTSTNIFNIALRLNIPRRLQEF